MKAPRPEIPTVPVKFEVGTHVLIVGRHDRRWTVMVDGAPTNMTFQTEADAWEAGVHEADRLDRG